jgi:hypothetical protein
MNGLIGKLRAAPGKREQLLELILQATGAMPGCLSYVVARDPADTSALWVTEVWTDAESHKAAGDGVRIPDRDGTGRRRRPDLKPATITGSLSRRKDSITGSPTGTG